MGSWLDAVLGGASQTTVINRVTTLTQRLKLRVLGALTRDDAGTETTEIDLGRVDVREYHATYGGDTTGATDCHGAIAAADTAAQAAGRHLHAIGNQRIDSDIAIASPIEAAPGARHSGSGIVTYNGTITCDPLQRFFPDNIVLKRGVMRFVTPFMFGAIGDGVTDDLAAFTRCGNAAVQAGVPIIVPQPRVCYRLTGQWLLGQHYVDESELLDYKKGIWRLPATSLDAGKFATAQGLPMVSIIGDNAILWFDFSASSETACIFYGIVSNPNKDNSDRAKITGLIVRGQSAMTGSPPTATADASITAPGAAKQIGIATPGCLTINVDDNTVVGCKIGFLNVDHYWGSFYKNRASRCERGQILHGINALHVQQNKANYCSVRGYEVTGQEFEAQGLHTQECETDVWIPWALSAKVSGCYWENKTGSASAALIVGDGSDLTQVSTGLEFASIHSSSVSTAPARTLYNAQGVVFEGCDFQRTTGGVYSVSMQYGLASAVDRYASTAEQSAVNVDPSGYPASFRKITVPDQFNPHKSTRLDVIMTAARFRTAVHLDRWDYVECLDPVDSRFRIITSGTGLLADDLTSGLGDGSYLAYNLGGGAATIHAHRVGGPKRNTVTAWYMRTRLQIAALGTDFDWRFGWKHPTAAQSPQITMGLIRANSTTNWSIESGNGNTYGTSSIAVAAGGMVTFESWWTNSGSIYFSVNSETPVAISDADLSGSATIGALLGALYYSADVGAAQRLAYVDNLFWAWND